MNELDRIHKIESALPTGEKRAIRYRGQRRTFEVMRIPLQHLLYNAHNGRIRSITKSYESRFHDLDPAREADKLLIEQYLFDSATNRNEKTLDSLAKTGQQESGIVTKDGIIIDGNRRAMLLNILYRQGLSDGYFQAIVLPDKLKDNAKEIVTLETTYQMGVDSKVDYNPIEKYIRCKELIELHHYTLDQVAEIMAEGSTKIQEWLNILNLMDEYLTLLESPGVYTRLEKKEGHFVDLHNYLKSYQRRASANWNFSNSDLQKLKSAYFVYIRLGIPVMRARVIGNPASKNSFFCHYSIWAEFYADLNAAVAMHTGPSYIQLKANSPEKSYEDLVRIVDAKWKEEVGGSLHEVLAFHEGVLKDTQELRAPAKILKRVLNSLGQIDNNAILNADRNEIDNLLNAVIRKLHALQNVLISKGNQE